MLPRRIRYATVPVLAGAMLALSACGGDDPTGGNSGDTLSSLEAELVFTVFFSALDGIDIPLLETVGPAATPYGEVYNDVISGSQECPGGGSSSISGGITGDVDDQAGTGDITATADVDFVACLVPGETISITLDGDPDVGISAHIVVTETTASIDIDAQGALAFETSDGRSGTCAIDATLSASASSTSLVENETGTVCGVDASNFELALFD